MNGLVSLKFIRVWQVRHVGQFLPREYNMEKYFIQQLVREGHIERCGMGYYVVTDETQRNLEALKVSLIKMDKEAGRKWE